MNETGTTTYNTEALPLGWTLSYLLSRKSVNMKTEGGHIHFAPASVFKHNSKRSFLSSHFS